MIQALVLQYNIGIANQDKQCNIYATLIYISYELLYSRKRTYETME